MLEVSAFQGRRLEMDLQGATRFEGCDGRYDDPELSVAGASKTALRGIAVTDPDMHRAGAGRKQQQLRRLCSENQPD